MKDRVFAAADVGGTKILLLLAGPQRDLILRRRLFTPPKATPDQVVEVIAGALTGFLEEAGLSPQSLAGLGVCIAALLDFESGVIYESPNLDWHEPVPFRELLAERFSCPVFLENDCNAAILGEASYGAARGHRDAAYITISTGIGAGLYLDGRVYRGSGGFAGEIGHLKRFGKGRRCGCGGYDCLEAWASGKGIARSAGMLWGEGDPGAGTLDTAAVFDRAEAGDPLAGSIIEQAVEDIGISLANLATLLNLSCMVIGGGVARHRPGLVGQIEEKVNYFAVPPAVRVTRVKVVAAALEPEAGAWGMYAAMRR
ncbi:MAG: ROK family protein [Firmicutes bacterium]|nr:ROK family protein [Bacillota bacterium]